MARNKGPSSRSRVVVAVATGAGGGGARAVDGEVGGKGTGKVGGEESALLLVGVRSLSTTAN